MTTKRSYDIIARYCFHSLMDKTPVCGIGTPGSTPGESTNSQLKSSAFELLLFVVLTRSRKKLLAKPDKRLFVRIEAAGSRRTVVWRPLVERNTDAKVTESLSAHRLYRAIYLLYFSIRQSCLELAECSFFHILRNVGDTNETDCRKES